MKKRILAAMIAAATVLSLAGCKDNTTSSGGGNSGTGNSGTGNSGTNSDTPSTGSPDAYQEAQKAGTGTFDTSGEGKVFNIYCWNGDFKKYVENSGYKVPDGITINWIEVPNNGGAYQKALDEALMKQGSAAADDKVDLFLAEADYILKYSNAKVTQDVTKLGVQKWDTGYDYTYNAATSPDGVLKGVSWQANPSLFIYRRSIAKDVLGTDDPAEVQKALETWDKVDETAQKAKDKGYVMFASPLETYRTFANNSTVSYLNGDKFATHEAFDQWLAQAEKYVKNGWSLTYGLWATEKSQQMFADGKMMCCVGPAWYFNFSMGAAQKGEIEVTDADGNKSMITGAGTNGDWAICKGPQAHFWGGTWLMAAEGSDNPKMIADLMNAFTANEQIMEYILKDAKEFPNNKNVVNKYANDASYGLEFLGGQNHIAAMAAMADEIVWDSSLHTVYDQTFNEDLPNTMLTYLNGTVSKDQAMKDFYRKLSDVAPKITHD